MTTPRVAIDMNELARNGLILSHRSWYHDLPDGDPVGTWVLATDITDAISFPAQIVESTGMIHYLKFLQEDVDAAYDRQAKGIIDDIL
jgi:hypothetical protein